MNQKDNDKLINMNLAIFGEVFFDSEGNIVNPEKIKSGTTVYRRAKPRKIDIEYKFDWPTKSEVDKLVENHLESAGTDWSARANPAEDLQRAINQFSLKGLRERSELLKAQQPEIRKKVNAFFFRQFRGNEIHSSDYIKLKNDGEIELSCSGGNLKDFMNTKLGLPYQDNDMGKIPNVNYPNRSHSKKRKFSLRKLIKKVVQWWRT